MRLASSLAAIALAVAAPVPAASQPAVPAAPPAAAPAALPAAQAALGRRLAELGDFNAIVGAMGHAEIEAMATGTPDLTAAERARLRQVGEGVLASGRARMLAIVGDIYGRHFTAGPLRAIIAFLESPPGRAYVGALPQLLPRIAMAMQGVDLRRDVRAAFCRETGKLCQAE
jgi:hypothetical protein